MYTVFTFLSVFTIIISVNGNKENVKPKPNIVMIVADDLGWDDVSFHGSSQVLTPNIDMLAYTGVALERYYSHCVCTPSRAAILTGKFAHTLGMNGYPLTYGEDMGIPLKDKLLPEYFKDIGYTTHLVGKWHVGLSRDQYLPTSRGFDSHFGFRGGTVDYYAYVAEETWIQGSVSGFDLYHNKTLAGDVEGYLTEVLTEKATQIIRDHNDRDPLFLMVTYSAPHAGIAGAILQAPPETVGDMRHIVNPNRRIFAAMMKKLDDGVGTIFKTLSNEGMLENTVIVFISDNGGMPIGLSMNYASNWPLRGSKMTPFEGGIRVVGLLWTQTLNITRHRFHGNFHAVDWLPTLLKSVGEDAPLNTDGVDHWNQIIQEKSIEPSYTRREFYEIFTCAEDSFSAVVSGDFKLIVGNVTREYSKHLGSDLRGIIGDGPDYENTVQNSEVYRLLTKQDKDFLNMNWEELRKGNKVNCKAPLEGKQLCNTGNEGNQYCLYNIKNDPCELTDVSEKFPDVSEDLLARLRAEMNRAVNRPCPVFRDPRALPALHNFTWTTWANDLAISSNVDQN